MKRIIRVYDKKLRDINDTFYKYISIKVTEHIVYQILFFEAYFKVLKNESK